MRIGSNPEKENNKLELHAYHRVVVPVFIPHFEGYFTGAFEVFKLCLGSLIATVHDKTRITVYNNNCHADVEKYINECYKQSPLIDQVFHSKENLGKINAMLAAVKGNIEPLITVTDADVLFKHHWQKAVEKIFLGFPEAGMVGPVPSSKAYSLHTINNWWYGFFKGKMFFDKVSDPIALQKFDASLGSANPLYKPIHLEKFLLLANKEKNCEAVMGCGHFVATLQRKVFDIGSNGPSYMKIHGGVEEKFIDEPNEDLGFLRLATKENFAYHMGNTVEKWMVDEFAAITKAGTTKVLTDYQHSSFPTVKKTSTPSIFKFVFGRLLSNRPARRFILNRLGLQYSGDY